MAEHWRWRTEEERDQAISDDTIEHTSPKVAYVHPEEIGQCIWKSSKPEREKIVAKCPQYEREWDWEPEYLHCACIKFWGTGFDGLCEMAVINPDETI